ncbi:DUF317 domain-containing protein [Kitasatospora sp. NPDC048538]|uniref:DUF317 domain-containing protein n=1 Tax=Kitasatospora sp. NPDC048538 TaxID=3155633 RepID=UPI0033F0C436
MPTAPTITDHVLVRPLHLAGPGTEDFAFHLGAHYGWYRPESADRDIVLASPNGDLTLARHPGTGRWRVTAPSPIAPAAWSIDFDDRTPSEITAAVLYTLAAYEENAPAAVLGSESSGHAAAFGILHGAGWPPQRRDGHQVALAPDRLAALARPLFGESADTVLTGAADTGTWNVVFSDRTPSVLLQSAATELLQPALRRPAELPVRHRDRMTLEQADARVTGRAPLSAAARAARSRTGAPTTAHPAAPAVTAAAIPAPRRASGR